MGRGRVSQLVNQSTDNLLLLRLVDVDCCLALVVVAPCAVSSVDGGNAKREDVTDRATDKQTKSGSSQKDHNDVSLLLLPCRIIDMFAAAASNKGVNKRQQQDERDREIFGHSLLRTSCGSVGVT